ncbi:purine and uridine phosphorylase [Ophiobolus disseminans]|uniref:Purine and uridine phosphorylase n=1 Tax=Ophiobolus disseminans TaxID=1469910 RepID=A0A6A6ZG19_9PLEO|nr:purine and uridine phosphorylase [Ophiobolus disseminans]
MGVRAARGAGGRTGNVDEEHDSPPYDAHDTNLYTCGRIGEHNVIITCLPNGQTGTNAAAAVAVQMKSTFPSTRFGLMVGIGGGVPSEEAGVRLGDVVSNVRTQVRTHYAMQPKRPCHARLRLVHARLTSKPHQTHGGVVRYDSGKATASGFERTGALNTPPTVLLNAVGKVRAKQMRVKGRLLEYLSKLDSLPDFSRKAAGLDNLFEAEYKHAGRGATCEKCSAEHTITRETRRQEVAVHYGTIASGNQVINDAAVRDKLSAELGGVLCLEMEAAGLMNSFLCLVVRGICDYADSHKNNQWQPYAAATATACAKEVLSVIPPAEVAKAHTVDEAIREASDSQKLSIVGLGGTGKTQVALQFAYIVKETLPEWFIFWMPALSMESFEQACASVGRALCIPQAPGSKEDVKKLMQQHLSSSQAGQWLLVVDNANDADIFFRTEQSRGIVDYLPESETGVVV